MITHMLNEIIKEKFSQRKQDKFILEELEQRGSILSWHLLDVVPVFRNVHDTFNICCNVVGTGGDNAK